MNANKCIYRSKSRLNNWPFSYQLNESLLGKIFLVITDSSLNAIGNSAIDAVRTFYESCSKVKFPTTMGLLKLAFFYPKCKESNPKKNRQKFDRKMHTYHRKCQIETNKVFEGPRKGCWKWHYSWLGLK